MATFIAIKNAKAEPRIDGGEPWAMSPKMRKPSGVASRWWRGITACPSRPISNFSPRRNAFTRWRAGSFTISSNPLRKKIRLSPQLANAIGVELAEKEFPDFEVLVATHIDTGHLHNHLIVNSVSCVDGRKLHQNSADLQHHREHERPNLFGPRPECPPKIEKA